MIQRRKPLTRKTPIKRTGLKRITKERSGQRRMYNKDCFEYLLAHPFCQIYLARYRIDEESVIALSKESQSGIIFINGQLVPRATQIHHRNKARGERLLDKRWWMSACDLEHNWVETHKEEARKLGLLLPIQADAHGRWGAGQQALTTYELIRSLARG